MFDGLTDNDLRNLQSSLNQFKQKEIDGDARAIEFIDGPFDGSKHMVVFAEGEPSREFVSLSLDGGFNFEKEHAAAYYK